MQTKLYKAVYWLLAILSFTALSFYTFLFHIADYDVYRVLNISVRDLSVLFLILMGQYFLLKKIPLEIFSIFKKGKQSKSTFLFYKALCILLVGACLNSSLIFWMHEESNSGRHLRYAKQLAEQRDSVAELNIALLLENKAELSPQIDQKTFWEKQWINNSYLASNYNFIFSNNSITKTTKELFKPILKTDDNSKVEYKVYLPDDKALYFQLRKNFGRSIYSDNIPFKELEDLADFKFAVVDQSEVILANASEFNEHILDVDLPPVGEGEKINIAGFDVLAYRHSDSKFVLIGEPLSELQVWVSNFAFFFTLLISLAISIEILKVIFKGKRIIAHWQEQPIQLRIQITLIAVTCGLFFIVASTTFIFLSQNNSSISRERKISASQNLSEELTQGQQHNWELSDLTTPFLRKLSSNRKYDIDIFSPEGELITSSYVSSANNTFTEAPDAEVTKKINANHSLILVEELKTKDQEETYLRTYFGLFKKGELQGIASISSFTSNVGTAPYIPIVMVKLLNVYVFLLLVSWAGGLFFISLITNPLQLLATRIKNFQLGEKNDKLAWKGEDAIGQLITEYNKMVDKVEVTTKELIKKEREGAWQVMAQQIAHEINNKLTPLRLNIQFLTRVIDRLNAEESETIQRITSGLIEKLDGLSKVAKQFNMFANLDNPSTTPIAIDRFLKDFLATYEKQDDFQYLIKQELTKDIKPIVNVDAQHLTEVLKNIISNSENAIPENRQGVITLSVKTEKERVIIEAEDNGKGIEEETAAQLFDPTFSVNNSQTGLGLPICKRIVEFYNGDLEFESETGSGTCFFISFPAHQN
ncbi:MAG: PAS domain-containing sensor histidine kinase [Saprospiraceae bacterium]